MMPRGPRAAGLHFRQLEFAGQKLHSIKTKGDEMRSGIFAAGWVCAALVCGAAGAQSTVGFGTAVLIPVAQTGTFSSEIWVHNALATPPGTSLTANITFFEAIGSANPGVHSCGQVVVGDTQAVSFALGTKCGLGAGSHFGMLAIVDAAPEQLNGFFAYSRTQNFQAIGFSVEGFPVGNLSAQSKRIAGLKRVAGPIPFQTNCFVSAIEQTVNYRIRLFDGTSSVQLGSAVTGTLQPFETIRYLDIFAAAGAPAGDYTNVNAVIQSTNTQVAGN